MGLLFLTFIVVGAVLALVCAAGALRAYLRYRRARVELQNHLTAEVESLARRTSELEEGVSALQTRAAQLPLRISEIQHSLSTLRVLSRALAASLGQAQRVLSYSAFETPGGTPLGRLLRVPDRGEGPPS